MPQPKVSVIVPFRNEEKNLTALLSGLCGQDYSNYEILLIDDHSTDNSQQIVKSKGCEQVRLLSLSEETGKKAAQSLGIAHVSGEIVVFTDADCQHKPTWLSEITSCMAKKQADVCLGNVMLEYEQLLSFQAFVSLEFAALLAVTAGSSQCGCAFMANGANLAIKAQLLNRTDFKPEIASGDDVFLLQSAQKQRAKIRFCHNCTVLTQAPASWSQFISQRLRWASKTSATSLWNRLTALIVFMANLALGTAAFVNLGTFLKLLSVKFLSDLLITGIYLAKHKRLKLLLWAPVLEIFYIFYAVYVGIISQLKNYEWKGRKYKPAAA